MAKVKFVAVTLRHDGSTVYVKEEAITLVYPIEGGGTIVHVIGLEPLYVQENVDDLEV